MRRIALASFSGTSALFDTRYRYTAAAFAYNIGLVVEGAIPPILGGAITAAYGAFVFGLFLGVLCLISFLSAIGLPETRNRDLSDVLAPVHSGGPSEGAR